MPDAAMTTLSFENADILRPDGVERGTLSFAGEVLTEDGGRAVDLSGCLILPGIVDLHGDGFERHLAPRRGAMMDLAAGLQAVDAELAANGITTAVLAQFYSYEGGMRRADFAERMVAALGETRPALLTDMHLQLRLETHMIDDYPRAEALIAGAGIRYVVFNDHLPHDALAAGKRPPRLTGQALKSRRSPEAHLALLHELHGNSARVPAALAALAARLTAQGVQLGSHDDSTPEQRAGFRAMGATIAEFPETHAVAVAARAAGDPIILGAPNVMRGGSHAGNVSATDLVAEGLCDALVSDYHYPSLRHAALKLGQGDAGLAAAWRLVSERPAEILGLSDRGRLMPGLRADLLILDRATGRIGATICGGRITYAAGAIAHRLWG